MAAPQEVLSDRNQDPTLRVMECIHGADIEHNLLDLASVGGTAYPSIPEQPTRFAVSRLALGEADKLARATVIQPLMENAGMAVQEHPFGIIGTLPGAKPELPPLVIMSHTDSVPRGDMYDGDTGVIGGIKVVESLSACDIQPERTIHVISMTGEESSAFGFALFGSRGMFHGLSDRELDARIAGGKSIRETLGEADTEIVRHPIIGPGKLVPTPFAVIELHVEQNKTLNDADIDLGVVEAIAAPVRFSVECGADEPLAIEPAEPANARYMVLSVHGKSDHSGATPMGHENRADGLVETARFLLGALEDEPTDSALEITAIDVADQAINKVPGVTTALLRISGGNVLAVAEQLASLEARRSQHNAALASPGFRFPEEPITLMEIERPDTAEFFAKAEVQARQKAALSLIVDVNEAATAHAGDKVVGTVGTYTMSPNGTISLGVDIRGIDKSLRNGVIEEIQAKAAEVEGKDGARFGERLAGSTDPVALDPGLVTRTKELIDSYAIGSSTVMYSAAGHDAQNAAMAGIPTVMIFCQSNAGGIAHHPDAYTNPHNLEQGVRALAALTMDLAA